MVISTTLSSLFALLIHISSVFDDRYGNTPPFRDAWLPVGLFDAATFHQVLSNAALNLASLRARGRVPETHETMMHHTKAITLVKQKIANKITATGDNVIAGITAFACYAVRISYYPILRYKLTRCSSMLQETNLNGICT